MGSKYFAWTAPVGAVALVGLLVAGIIGATSGGQNASRGLGVAIIMLVVIAILGFAVAPSMIRLSAIRRQNPGSVVRNVRRSSSLTEILGGRAPNRPTIVASSDGLAIYGGFLVPRLLIAISWTDITRLELGSVSEMYLIHDAIEVVMKDQRRLSFAVDENQFPLSRRSLEALCADIATLGGVDFVESS